MSRSATYSTEAIVLRTRLIGEKDRVMTLFSSAEGKFDAVARGARNPKSKMAATSQPFVRARFLLARGRNLDIASQAEIETAHIHISADLWRTAWAIYACEVTSIVPPRQPDAALFELLHATLAALDDNRRDNLDIEIAGFWFQARFLEANGYAAMLGRCVVSGEKIVISPTDLTARVAFSPELGGTLCATFANRDPQRLTLLAQSLRALRVLERAPEPPLWSDFELTTQARRDLRDCLRRSLLAHLDAHPKSQKFLDEVADALPPTSIP